jgi:hypothetical protein
LQHAQVCKPECLAVGTLYLDDSQKELILLLELEGSAVASNLTSTYRFVYNHVNV